MLRVGSLKDSTLITRPIGPFAVLDVVSPCYIKRFGKPKSQADLAVHWLVHYVNPKTYDSDIDEAKVTVALTQFEQVWAQIFPAEQSRIVQLLVERITVSTTGMDIRLRANGLVQLVRELSP